VPAYGASAAVGVLLALFLAQRTARMVGVDTGKVWNLCVLALFAALVGSRLLLVMLNLADLRAHPMWMLGLAMIHHPLLSAFGALSAVVVATVYGRWQRLPSWSTADALAAPLALGLAFEQLGALLAGSGYGIEATGIASHWAVTYTHVLAARWSGAPLGVPVHPVQAYAALAFFALSILLLALCQGTTSVVPQMQQKESGALAREKLHPWLFQFPRQQGDLLGLMLMGVGISVFATEFWRDPEGRGALFSGAMNGPQCAAVVSVVAGGLVLLERKDSRTNNEAAND
jgi:phosphatidylglycerol:prolipoprotein diacylglycerol transferase